MNNFPNQNPSQEPTTYYFSSEQPPEALSTAATKPQTKPITRTLTEILLAWGLLLLCVFLMEQRAFSAHPLGVFLALNALTAAALIYLSASGVRLLLKRLPLEILLFILSFSLLLNGNASVRACVVAFLAFSLPYRIATLCGALDGTLLSPHILGDFIRSYLSISFRHPGQFYPALFCQRTDRDTRVGRTIAFILLGLSLAFVPALIVILLLSYDAGFTDLLGNIFRFEVSARIVLSVLLAIPLAMFLFGVLLRGKRLALEEAPLKKISFPKLKLHAIILCSAVTPVLLIYVLFFVSQMPYYLSAFTGILPEELTYATYAKEGFFQLCAVSAINAVLLFIFSLLTNEEKKAARVAKRLYSAILSIFTLVLIATALSKMVLYINSYGLTQKRVYASWFMLLLAVAFIAVLLKQCVKKLPLVAILTVTVILFSSAIALVNTDSLIADYNVDAYLSQTLPEVDVQMLEEDLGISAVPALANLHSHLSQIPEDARSHEEWVLFDNTAAALRRLKTQLELRPNLSLSLPAVRASRALQDWE